MPNFVPQVGVILGSGLGHFADLLEGRSSLSYQELPNFPQPTVTGHAGNLVCGYLEGKPLAVLQGRSHLYEGHAPWEVAFPVRVLASPGDETLGCDQRRGRC